MRWQPHSAVCEECGFAWTVPRNDAIELVTRLAEDATAAVARVREPMQPIGRRWSASMYVWHLVDVMRIGTERLLTLAYDPGRGLTCWDENVLAETRHYGQLSPAVGLIVLQKAAREWVGVAREAPAEVVVRHPEFGDLGALEIIRRNAHEAHHHLMDINRYRDL
jgi:hypothetical protein